MIGSLETKRDRKKRDKSDRIRAAALALIRERGFEATTTRDIAARAGIAAGTLFLYVEDKYQLLQVVFGDALNRKTEQIFENFVDGKSLVEELMTIFGQLFDLYAQEMSLAREFLRDSPLAELCRALFNVNEFVYLD